MPAIRAGSGADVFVERLADGLREWGHEPCIQWFPHRFELMPWLLRNIKCPPWIDIVHAGSWQGYAFKRPGVPLIVTEHNCVWHPDFLRHRGVLRAVYHESLVRQFVTRTYACADALVANSDVTRGAIRAAFSREAIVIPNWVDTCEFAPCDAQQAKPSRPFRLLYVGNPSPWKGSVLIPELIAALGDDFEVWSLGGLRRAARRDAGGRGKLLGRMEPREMPSIYRQIDAVVVLSLYESFGYVALEAMSCGVPVVGFAAPATVEVCGRAGVLLTEPGNISQVVESARRLATDPKLRCELSVAGRRRAVHSFSQAAAIDGYVKVYRDAIGANRASGAKTAPNPSSCSARR